MVRMEGAGAMARGCVCRSACRGGQKQALSPDLLPAAPPHRPRLAALALARLSPALLPGVAQQQPNSGSADPVGSLEPTWGPFDSHPEATDHFGAGPGSGRSLCTTPTSPSSCSKGSLLSFL